MFTLRFAFDSQQQLIDAQTLTSESPSLICPACRAPVTWKQGGKTVEHPESEACTFDRYTRAVSGRIIEQGLSKAGEKAAGLQMVVPLVEQCSFGALVTGEGCQKEKKVRLNLAERYDTCELDVSKEGLQFVAKLSRTAEGRELLIDVSSSYDKVGLKALLGIPLVHIQIADDADLAMLMRGVIDVTDPRITTHNLPELSRRVDFCSGNCQRPVMLMVTENDESQRVVSCTMEEAAEIQNEVGENALRDASFLGFPERAMDEAAARLLTREYTHKRFLEGYPAGPSCWLCRNHAITAGQPMCYPTKTVVPAAQAKKCPDYARFKSEEDYAKARDVTDRMLDPVMLKEVQRSLKSLAAGKGK